VYKKTVADNMKALVATSAVIAFVSAIGFTIYIKI